MRNTFVIGTQRLKSRLGVIPRFVSAMVGKVGLEVRVVQWMRGQGGYVGGSVITCPGIEPQRNDLQILGTVCVNEA